MGVTISSKNKSIDLGCGGFLRLRTKIAELAGADIGEHYKKLNKAPIFDEEERQKFFDKYDKKILEIDEKYKGEMTDILIFLYASDCKAEIPVEMCKKIYEIIKDYDDDILYGYCGRPDCATFKDFKELVKDCIDNECIMEWY